MAAPGALYETLFYAGQELTWAASGGYAVGTGLTYVAQTYAPDWYYGTFVDTVGNTATWFQNTYNNIVTYSSQSTSELASYQQAVAPVMTVPSIAQMTLAATGGDAFVTDAWYETSGGGSGGGGGGCHSDCPPVDMK